MSVEVTIEDGQVIEVSIGAGADILSALADQAGILATKADQSDLVAQTDRIDTIEPEVDDLTSRVRGDGSGGAAITDPAGFELAAFDAGASRLAGVTAERSANGGAALVDRSGFELAMFDPAAAHLPGLTVETAPEGDVAVVDRNGFVLAYLLDGDADPADTLPIAGGSIALVTDQPLPIEARNLLSDRGAAGQLVAISGAPGLILDPAVVGSSVELVVRDPASDVRTSLTLPAAVAPATAPGGTSAFDLLIDSDSIGQYQGAYLLKQALEAMGYAPTFVGTVHGGSAPGISDDAGGPLGECRPGWQTGDVSGAYSAPYRFKSDGTLVTDGTAGFGIVEAGGESAYLAAPATSQRYTNPYLRPATGGDDPAIIRNGLVLDYASYCTRFSVPTPDVVLYGLGTNNAYFHNAADLFQQTYSDEMLVLSRMRAAWPDAKIIRYCPGTSSGPARDKAWGQFFAPVLRAIIAAHTDLADPGITLAPTWAMMPSETGFQLAATTPDPITGAVTAALAGPIHPLGATRATLYRALAGYVAAAALDLL